jgi:hypothetical protein
MWVFDLAGEVLKLRFFEKEHELELKGCMDAIGVNEGIGLTLNFMYDLFAHCTSVILRMNDGTVIHGRNLDYLYPDYFRVMVANYDWYKNGEVIFKSASIVGYQGIVTGVRVGAYSVSIDERDSGTLLENVIRMLAGKTDNAYAIRNALQNYDNYQDAFNYLKNVETIADSYYIMAGINSNEGAVITRARTHAIDFWALSEERWWLVETNYDHWKEAVAEDSLRRTVAIEYVEKAGQDNMNTLSLLEMMSQFPVLRYSTVYTSIMVPSSGYLYTL